MNGNQYLIICYRQKDGYILSVSQPLTIEQLKGSYNQYCLDILFSLKENHNIDSIGFDFKRIRKKMRTKDEQPKINFNKSVSEKLANGLKLLEDEIELARKYSEHQLIEIHNTFQEIKSFSEQNLFINKCQPVSRFVSISNKIWNVFSELVFLSKEDLEDIWSMLISTYIYIMSWCEKEEYYEVEFNLMKFIQLNFEGDVIQEKNNFLSILK